MTGHKQITLVPGSGSGIGFAIATTLAQAGHIVYASLRLGQPEAEKRSAAILDETEKINLRIVDLDVLSEASCRAAVDHILAEHGRIDIVVNNAGMLMTGITEAFDPDQFQRIFDTNATCWLRVNRAVLPAMRRQRSGTLVYVGSTTAHLAEPFLGPYAAAKAAGEDLTEIIEWRRGRSELKPSSLFPELSRKGLSILLTPSRQRSRVSSRNVSKLPGWAATLAERLREIDDANGGSLDVTAVGEALRDALAIPVGRRPYRIFVDGQRKGGEDVLAIQDGGQGALLEGLGLSDLAPLAPRA